MDYYKYIDIGDYIYGNERAYQLTSIIAEGGEGVVYTTDSNFVCKIYKTEKLDKTKYKKIRSMLQRNIDFKGICWPKEIVYDEYGYFRGYLMDKGNGKQIKVCIFNKKNFKSFFPMWNKKDLVTLSITILDKIQYLHDRNIILGDINQKNILVTSPTEVYFVDTDSYQIENYTCPVGTVLFSAPEIQGKKYSTIFRTFENEYFAIATLIFMILLVGKTPYNYQNTGELITNIKKGNFTLHLDSSRYKSEVEMTYRLIWAHLPFDIREAFYITFKKGEMKFNNYNRFTTTEWSNLMKQYYEVLDLGILQKRDSKANDIFPTPYFVK